VALSGSTDFNLDRDTLIGHVYRNILGAIASGEDPTADEITDASMTLNIMLKAWQADGLQLWVIKEATLIPEKGKEIYELGLTGDHCSTEMGKTEMRVAGASTDTILEVDDTTGMTASDNIGVVLDTGYTHWTTIASVTDSDTVVLDDALTSAVAVDNHIYHYTGKIDRPNELISVHRRVYDTKVDVEMTLMSRNEYYNLSDKDAEGTPVNCYYDPQLVDAQLRVWNTADTSFSSSSVFVLIIKKPFDDLDSATDDLEFPQEWYEAVCYGLATRLAPGISLPIDERRLLKMEAREFKEEAMGFDAEKTSVFFTP